MMHEPTRQVWKVSRLHSRRGQFFDSPPIEEWRECGYVVAPDEEAAAERALVVMCGTVTVRVEQVPEFYRPEGLL